MPPLNLLDQSFAEHAALSGLDADAELVLSAHRLRRLAETAGAKLGLEGRALVAELLEAAAETEQRLAEQAQRIRQLESLSVTDELTGLVNRRGFATAVRHALAACQRHGEPGLLILLDLDRFKAINDTYGHLAGDAVLKAVAELLQATLRKSDLVARLGGDEFAALLPRTRQAPGQKLATKLDRLVNSLRVPYGRLQIPVSASIGWESFGPRSHPDRLIFAADRALYRAKRPGAAPIPEPLVANG